MGWLVTGCSFLINIMVEWLQDEYVFVGCFSFLGTLITIEWLQDECVCLWVVSPFLGNVNVLRTSCVGVRVEIRIEWVLPFTTSKLSYLFVCYLTLVVN